MKINTIFFCITLTNVKSNRGIEQIQIPKTMDFKGNFNRTQKVYTDFIISFTFKSFALNVVFTY